jgi:DNA modification methylase
MTDHLLDQMVIKGSRDFGRTIKCCYCGEWTKRSIVPHLRKQHPDVWLQWRNDWIELYNRGLSPRHIMMRYSPNGKILLSWTVIESEIRKLAEERKTTLVVRSKERLTSWEPTPDRFKLEDTTVWDFPRRGDWSVHRGDYRGNWAPQIPRNLIIQYSNEGDLVLDPFVGGGTTLIECKLLERNGIGLDVSPHAIQMTRQRLKELERWEKEYDSLQKRSKPHDVKIEIKEGDARDLSFLHDESVDLVCTHPPYADAIQYTAEVNNDLSHIHDLEKYYDEMNKVAIEIHRVLKTGSRCAILIGDIRRGNMIIDVGFKVKELFQQYFSLEEIIIKTQHRDTSDEFYRNKNQNDEGKLRYRIAHEYLFVFRKLRSIGA